MPRLIAPLDFQAPCSTSEYVFKKYGLSPIDMFQMALLIWPTLDECIVDIEYTGDEALYAAVSDLVFQHPHLYSLEYNDHMDLVSSLVNIMYRFHDVLQQPISYLFDTRDGMFPSVSLVKWMPGAVMLDVH